VKQSKHLKSKYLTFGKFKSNKFIKFLTLIKLSTWILLGILILSGLVRLIGIAKESYWVDEILTVRQGQTTLSTLDLYLKGEMHMPLYIFLLWGWIHIFGTSEVATRIVSAIFGVLCVYVIFLLARRMFTEKVGIYSALLLALSPLAVYYSTEARLYSMFMLLVLLSFYFFISYLELNKRKYLIWYIIINILMLYTDIFAFVVLGIHALWIIFKNRTYLKQIFIALIISIATLIPIITNILLQYSNFDKSDKSWLVPAMDKLLLMLIHYAGSIILLILWVLVIIFGLFCYKNKSFNMLNICIFNKTKKTLKKQTTKTDSNLFILAIWLIIPIVAVYVLSIIQPLFNERYLLFTLPAYILLVVFFISQFKLKYQNIILILIIILSMYTLIIQYKTTNKDDWKNTAQFLKDNVKNDDYLLITPYYHQESLTYYYNQQCFKEMFMEHCNFVTKKIITINIGQNCCNKDTLVVDNNKFGELITKNNTFWLIQNREWINNNATPYNYILTQKKLVSKHQFDAGFGSKIEVYEFE
jgi:uncharacterized membrane protein